MNAQLTNIHPLPSMDDARAARDAGMQRAIDHAADVCMDWPARAYAFLTRFARTHESFISEECTEEAERLGFGPPTDPRAWGAIFQKASRSGVIARDGFGISQRRHLSPTPLWRSLVFAGHVA